MNARTIVIAAIFGLSSVGNSPEARATGADRAQHKHVAGPHHHRVAPPPIKSDPAADDDAAADATERQLNRQLDKDEDICVGC